MSEGEEERNPGTQCWDICEVTLVTCIPLRYTNIPVIFCLPTDTLQSHTHCDKPLDGFEVRKNVTRTIMVYIALFEAISELQRERLCHTSAEFAWNKQM